MSEIKLFYLCRRWNGWYEIVESSTRPNMGLSWQSVSGGYGTNEELTQKQDINPTPCFECGTIFGANYCEPYKTILKRDSVCFDCNHWRDMCKHSGSPRQAIVKGVHYLICEDEPGTPSRWKGHGGAKFTIKFKDGRTETCCNLWCQGTIPEHFKERLPDNAEFLTP